MTAMNQYLVEARLAELRDIRNPGRHTAVFSLFSEASQVLKGALLPVSGAGAALGRGLQKDLGLR